MKSLEELKARFASIQDLPVSEEMLGAYLEGNLDPIQNQCVEDLLQKDCEFASLVDGCKGIDDLYDSTNYCDETIDILDIENISFLGLPINAIDSCCVGGAPFFLDPLNSLEYAVCASEPCDFIVENEMCTDGIDRFFIDGDSINVETTDEDDVTNNIDL